MSRYRCAALIKASVLIALFLTLSFSIMEGLSLRSDFYRRFSGGEEVELSGRVYFKEAKLKEDSAEKTGAESNSLSNGKEQSVSEGKKYEYTYYVKTKAFSGYRVQVKSDESMPLYSNITVQGKVKLFDKARNEGGYDARKYYEGLGIFFELEASDFTACRTTFLTRGDTLFNLRQKLKIIYEKCLYEEESGVLSAIALGTKADLSADVKGILTGAGIAHILAVSGLHVSTVGRGLYRLLRRIGCSYAFAGLFSFILVLLYGITCGMSVSCIRAVGMFLIFVISEILGRGYHMGRAVFFMAVIILINNPFSLFSAGFIFSFVAVTGVYLVAGPLGKMVDVISKKWCEKHYFDTEFTREEIVLGKHVFRSFKLCKKNVQIIAFKAGFYLMKSFVSSLGIVLCTLPVVAWFYYEIPVYSVLINLLVLPVIGVLLIVGLLGGIMVLLTVSILESGMKFMAGFSQITSIDFVCEIIGKKLLYPCHLIIYYLELIADKSLLLPGSKFICGRPEIWSMVLYYFVLISGVKVCEKMFEKDDEKDDEKVHENVRKNVHEKDCLSKKKHMVLLSTKIIFLVTFFCLIFSKTWSAEYRITFLDVGQGDGSFLTDGKGCSIMIDGGSTSNKQLGKYTILPFLKFNGVRSVDYWFVSHCDDDHVSGLKYVLEQGYKVKGVFLSENVEKDDGYESLISLLDKADVETRYMAVGDRLVTDDFTLTCVFPDGSSAFIIGDDANAKSMVLKFEDVNGYKGLFVGDMSEKAERLMLGSEEKKYLVSGDGYDFLKVAHHGSKYSSSTDFLQAVNPKIAIISYGKNNYGHPSDDTINRLESVGSKILKTKEMGQINLRIKRRGIVLQKRDNLK